MERWGLCPQADARFDDQHGLVVREEWIDRDSGDGFDVDDQVRKLDQGQTDGVDICRLVAMIASQNVIDAGARHELPRQVHVQRWQCHAMTVVLNR